MEPLRSSPAGQALRIPCAMAQRGGEGCKVFGRSRVLAQPPPPYPTRQSGQTRSALRVVTARLDVASGFVVVLLRRQMSPAARFCAVAHHPAKAQRKAPATPKPQPAMPPPTAARSHTHRRSTVQAAPMAQHGGPPPCRPAYPPCRHPHPPVRLRYGQRASSGRAGPTAIWFSWGAGAGRSLSPCCRSLPPRSLPPRSGPPPALWCFARVGCASRRSAGPSFGFAFSVVLSGFCW